MLFSDDIFFSFLFNSDFNKIIAKLPLVEIRRAVINAFATAASIIQGVGSGDFLPTVSGSGSCSTGPGLPNIYIYIWTFKLQSLKKVNVREIFRIF